MENQFTTKELEIFQRVFEAKSNMLELALNAARKRNKICKRLERIVAYLRGYNKAPPHDEYFRLKNILESEISILERLNRIIEENYDPAFVTKEFKKKADGLLDQENYWQTLINLTNSLMRSLEERTIRRLGAPS